MRRTRIICTIGPATQSPAKLTAMIEAGMNVARLNFSHGDQEQHGEVIKRIRKAASDAGKPVAILQDLAGPKVRTGRIKDGPVQLISGNQFVLSSDPVAEGNSERAGLTYTHLPEDVCPGDKLLLSDGEISLRVDRIAGNDIICTVRTGGWLNSNKGINLPDRTISAPIISKKDISDLKFGLKAGVDFVAVSFVRSVKDLETVKSHIAESGTQVPVIAKIEKHEAIDIMDEIIEAVDGIMVARGDMAVEIPLEKVPRIQKTLILKANIAGKPVITATQMLKSMVDNPRPTRAETSDVANAILDGSDGIMLSEESAVGRYPVETVRIMSRIAAETEKAFPFRSWRHRFEESDELSEAEALACSAVHMARQIDAAAIVTFTQSGSTTRLVAKYRPSKPVLVMTPLEKTYHQAAMIWGAIPLMAEPADSIEQIEKQAISLSLKSGLVKRGDRIIVTAGVPLYVPGTTNLIRIIDVRD